MKKQILAGAVTLLATSLIAAEANPKDAVKAAAKSLGDKDNYSWTTSIEWGGNAVGTVQGKTEKGGATSIAMSRGDQSTEAVLKAGKGAIKTDEGWKSLSEAAESQQGGGRFIARMLQNFKAPAAEAEDIAGKVKELKLADGVYSGDLTDEGAKELMSFRRGAGGGGPDVKSAKGSAKFWVKDGQISKYEYSLEGTMTFNNEDRDV
ncbi:MAG TPA: hypothetical protein VJA21_27740, partial [Verrucomicrobiae bacterium]